jgi:H+/Cl- antiporter ClcA
MESQRLKVCACLAEFNKSSIGSNLRRTVNAAYLNGIHVQRFFNLRTILVKIVGTICSVSSGFASGPEGPMIHIGAGIASGVTRGDKIKNFVFEFSPAVLGKFHNDR